MGVRETRARSLDWVKTIRAAQEQFEQRNAADASMAAADAMTAQVQAIEQCDDAMRAWLLVAEDGLPFDPGMAMSWAHELMARDARLVAAKSVCQQAADIEEVARTEWQAAVSRAEQATANYGSARNRAAAKREENRLAELADITAFRSARA